jgi:rod shape-determining protein MreC
MVVSVSDTRDLSLAESVIGNILLPVQTLFSNVSNEFSGLFLYVGEFKDIRENYYDLVEDIKQYQDVEHENDELRAENERLNELMAFVEEHENYVIKGAHIIGKDPDRWYGSLTIDRGSNDGVELNMAVMTQDGLVGRVVEVASNWSRVQILLDSNSSVSAIVQRTLDEGIVKGNVSSLLQDESLQMIYLPLDADIQTGDKVITSGFGDIFPKGLYIGTVTELFKNEYDAFITAEIEANVDFYHLEEVLLVSEVR